MSNSELVTIFHSQLKEYIKEYYKLQERNYRNAFTDHTCYNHLKIIEQLIQSGDIDLMTQSLKEQCDSNQYQQLFGIKPNRPVLRFQEVVVWMMTNHRDVYETIFNQIHQSLLESQAVQTHHNDYTNIIGQTSIAFTNWLQSHSVCLRDGFINHLNNVLMPKNSQPSDTIIFHDIKE